MANNNNQDINNSISLSSSSSSSLSNELSSPLPTSSLSSSPLPSFTGSPRNSTTTSVTLTFPSDCDDKTPKSEALSKQRSKNGYIARVGFDTLDCEDTVQYALTLQARTDKWKRAKNTRTFLVCTDLSDYSSHALQWVMENMVEDGDEIVALRVVPMELRDSFAKNGVPSFHGQEFAAREEATKIMEMIRERNKSKEINIVVECLVGFVRDTIQHMIKMYEPTMLVVGTRGHSKVKGFLLGSISRYCLHYSPIPVIVVRPASKLVKSKNKSKGIFRRRTSFQVDAEEIRDTQPQLFYSSPVSRQTSRSSSDTNDTISKVTMEELGRKDSRSPEPSYPYHQHHRHSLTAAEKASAAKKGSMPSIFSINPTSTLTPPTPSDSISSSLSYASAMLSSSPPANKPSPPPEGFIKMRKSVTSDGISGSYWSDKEKNADREKKSGNRGVFAKLSGSIFSGPRTRA